MKKLFNSFVAVVFCLVVLTAAVLASSSHASTKMPTFVLADVVDGKEVASDDFHGKTLLVTFFATWCPPCLQEIPTLVELQKEFANDGFSVIGLSVDQGGATEVARFVTQQEINYPVLMADAQIAENFGGVYGIPVSFLVNKSGNVVKTYTGLTSHKVLLKDIRHVME